MKAGRALAIVGVGILLAMCGPAAVETLGDAMVDTGMGLRDAASSDAAAQTTCSNWEIQVITLGITPTCRNGMTPCSVPAGWEPFAVTISGTEYDYWIRRCAP